MMAGSKGPTSLSGHARLNRWSRDAAAQCTPERRVTSKQNRISSVKSWPVVLIRYRSAGTSGPTANHDPVLTVVSARFSAAQSTRNMWTSRSLATEPDVQVRSLRDGRLAMSAQAHDRSAICALFVSDFGLNMLTGMCSFNSY